MNTDPAATIPEALRALDQWVCWKSVPDRAHPEKKPKKLPIDAATGKAGSSIDPATWGSYAECVDVAGRRRLSGVGFVFSPDDPFVGIDLDGCLDPETGELQVWAARWVAWLLTVGYCEVSPSGTGIKAIVRGAIPKALSKKDAFGPHEGIEIYDRGRYFTITGLIVDGSIAEPDDGQEVLDALFAEFDQSAPAPELPAIPPPAPVALADAPLPVQGWRGDRARMVDERIGLWVKDCLDWARREMAGASEGDKHNRRLQLGKFLGGVVASAPSHLSPEAALAELYGAKVPESHHSQELRAIRDGLTTGMGLPLTPGAVGEKDGRDFLPTDDEPVVIGTRAHCPRCREAIRRSRYDYGEQAPGWYCPKCKWPMVWPLSGWSGGEVAQAAGPAVGPVVLPVTAAPDQARELPLLLRRSQLKELPPAVPLIPEILFVNRLHLWFGEPGHGKSLVATDVAATVGQVYNVVYVAAEAPEDYDDRLTAWELLHEVTVENVYYWRRPIRFAVAGETERFIGEIAALRPGIVFIDPLASCMSGLVESTQEGMQVAIDAMNAIREMTGAGVVAVHHSGWDATRERGSSSLRGAARDVARIEKLADGTIRMTCVKKNQGAFWTPRLFRLVDSGPSVAPLPANRVIVKELILTDRHMMVLEALTQEGLQAATHGQLVDYTGYPKSTVYQLLTNLKKGGYIQREEKGNAVRYKLTREGELALEASHDPEGSTANQRTTKNAGRFAWEICPPRITGLPSVGSINPDESPTMGPAPYTVVPGYGARPEADEMPAETWDGDGGAEPEPEPGPSVASGMAERLRARREGGNGGSGRATAD
jgi:DNA-binding MarR family transcriptional regulator